MPNLPGDPPTGDRRPIASRNLPIWQRTAVLLARANISANTISVAGMFAGIIAGLAARGAPLAQAAAWGVALHARAGRALAERLGPIGYLAGELAGEIPRLMDKLAH